jgi:Brp/Blh family beta-carotene 15,15'-monooxygenase
VTAIRIQGIAFSVVAILLTAASVAIKPVHAQTELVVLAVLIAVLGVPHGALDTIFAQKVYKVRTVQGWIRFTLAYLIPAALVVVLWQLAPIVFLIGFLAISLVHFSGDPSSGTPLLTRILYGGAIIVLPALLHAAEVTRLFSFLVGGDAAASVVPWLHLLSWLWLVGVGVAATCCLRSDWPTALEIASVGLLSTLLMPLLAFTIFFCGMHSLRHILRTLNSSAKSSPNLLLSASIVPLLACFLVFGAGFLKLRQVPLEARMIQLIFVGLAALTVPHMALVEQVRFSGWGKEVEHS